jgi:hypothetical protein
MHTRTRHSIVSFHYPFSLSGVDGVQPAGEYSIAEDDEIIEGLSWIAWQRTAAFIYLPLPKHGSSSQQMVPIDYAELNAALELDRERVTAGAN